MNREKMLSAQSAVLGSLLIDGRVEGEFFRRAKEYYFTGSHLLLFQAARDLHLQGRIIDPITATDALKQGGYPADEARAFVYNLMEITPTAANMGAYFEVLETETVLSTVHSAGLSLTHASSIAEAREQTELLALTVAQGSKFRVMGMVEGVVDFIDRMDTPIQPIPWGFQKLDDALISQRGDFVILGGRPSSGKTALSLHMAWEQSKTSRVGYFSFETSPEEIMNRLVCMVAAVDSKHIRRRSLSDQECDLIADASKDFNDRKLDVIAASAMSVEDIRAQTVAAGYNVIYIDYVQLVNHPGRDRFGKVTEISMALHRMALNLGILVVGLSQLSRPDKQSKVKAPTLSDLRESGQLEQDAEAVLLLYREDESDSTANRKLRIAKNKKGRAGGFIEFSFDGPTQRFFEVETIGNASQPFVNAGKKAKLKNRAVNQTVMAEFTPLVDDGSKLPF